MKPKYLILILLAFTAMVFATGVEVVTVTPAVTTVAANTTNTTAGTSADLGRIQGQSRIYVTASGVASTTNGVSALGSTFFFSTSYDGTTFDTINTNTTIKVILLPPTSATNTVSTSFDLRGASNLRLDRIENPFFGPLSNIAVRISGPQQPSRPR